MSEKKLISLRNSDLFFKSKLTHNNKEEKYIENVKSLISEKGPSLGENNHFKFLHAFSLLTTLQARQNKSGVYKNEVEPNKSGANKNEAGPNKNEVFVKAGLFVKARHSSSFNKTITSYPFSSGFLKSGIKKPTFEKATGFKNGHKNNNQETQNQKLKYNTAELQNTYPLRYKLQTKLTSIFFELNDSTKQAQQENKAELKKQYLKQQKRTQSSAKEDGSFVQAAGSFESALNKIESSIKSRSNQLGLEVVHTSKPEHGDCLSSSDAKVKQSKTKLSSVQSILKLNSHSLYFKSFLYRINRGICSGISQNFSIVAINLILFSVLTIVQRNHYGKSSSAISKKDFIAILCASKLPNLTARYGISTEAKQIGVGKNKAGLSKNKGTAALKKAGLFKAKTVHRQSLCKPVTKPECTSFACAKNKNEVGPNKNFVFVKAGLFVKAGPKFLYAPVVNKKQTNFVYQRKGCQFKQAGINNLLFVKSNLVLFPYNTVTPWYVTNKILLSTKHYKKTSSKRKFEINSNLREKQLLTENKADQLGEAFVFVKKKYAIKPWYCIKANNIWNNQIIATRSSKQTTSNNFIYEHQIVPKSQYYIPYNISQRRIIAESDTIPEKRDSINFKIVAQQNKIELSRLVSELVLKKCFYKNGFFLTKLNELNKKTHSNLTIQSEKEGNFFGVKTVGLMCQQNQVKGFDNKAKLCLETQLTLKEQEKNNHISGSTRNNYINLALYKKRTISFLDTSNSKSSTIGKPILPEFVPSKKASFVSSMPINLRSKQESFNKNMSLNEAHSSNLVLQKIKFVLPSLFYKTNNLIKFTSNLVKNKTFLSSGLTWSRYNLEKSKILDLVQVRKTVQTFNFRPDTLVPNTSVSGYQFPELQRKEIGTLFRKLAIFGTQKNRNDHFYFQALANNTSFNTQQQISNKAMLCSTISFCSKPYLNINVKPSFSCAQPECTYQSKPECTYQSFALVCKGLAKSPNLSSVGLDSLSRSLVDHKMQYTQLNLDEIESVKKLFEQMGRDYESYIRQPKDSLPALIISPSLEDDREIEEEGIRIFRKRDLLKKKNSKAALTNSSKDRTFLDDLSIAESQDSEKQNHQILVRNALRQAQEEIDDIAKKEEKGGEKDKQVIPPLTRLEALYTIRQREKKNEQAKNFKRKKGNSQTKLTFINKSFPVLEQLFLYSDKLNINFLSDFQFVDIYTPHLFSKLGDEKSNKAIQNARNVSLVTPLSSDTQQGQNKSGAFVFVKAYTGITKTSRGVQKRSGMHKQSLCKEQKLRFCYGGAFCNRLAQAEPMHGFLFACARPKFVQTLDRKHSFFGEISLPAHKLTAQKQKQVFEQKGNPLVKLNTRNTKVVTNKVKLSGIQALAAPVVQNKSSFVSFHSTIDTVPFSLLSPLSISSKTHNKKLESPKFKVGTVKTNIIPPVVWEFENETMYQPSTQAGLNQNEVGVNKNEPGPPAGLFVKAGLFVRPDLVKACTGKACARLLVKTGPKIKVLLKQSLDKKVDRGVNSDLVNWVRGPNRIYFYDNLSQNKACQGSTPKIKGTPLGSPVYHRVWQPKRMEPSTFRVLQRSQNTPVVPKISQKDWQNIIEWQLKKHFFEEDKRLRSLDNTDKRFKIKKVNLYLPWICITKAPDKNAFAQAELMQTKADLNYTSTGIKTNALVHKLHLPESCFTNTSLTKNNVEKKEGIVVPLQNNLSKILLQRYKTRIASPLPPYKKEFLDSNTQLNYQSNRYWRLPTKQNLFSISTPRKTQIYRSKQSWLLSTSTQNFIQTLLGKKRSLSLQSKNTNQNKARGKNVVLASPQFEKGVAQKVFKESFLFESVTGYSWLFIYTFVSVLMFKQLFKWVYQAGLKDFFVKFLNSDFGRTITSEEFRYSIQNIPLKESYMPKKRLQELFSLDKNKAQLLEVVWFLRNHCQGRHGPRGVLLVGPPGVENVSVVQAIAGEAKVPIIVQSLEKIAQDNEPQRQLEQLYMRAHKHAPCVLFLDQLDTVGARRDQLFIDKAHAHNLNYRAKIDLTSAEVWTGQSGTSNKLPDSNPNPKKQNLAILKNKLNVVLRLLTILDGVTQSSGVVTVATARDITKLDPALLRPKRFDRRIYLSLPTRQDRVQLFKIQTQNIGHIKEMPWDYLSLQTENMSTGDIQSAINYSLFRAVLKRSVHTVETLEYGIDCVKALTEKRVAIV